MTTALPPSETASTSSSDQVTLSETDRSRLSTCIHTGHTSARVRTRAQVLLKLGEGWSLVEVCRVFDVCRNTAVRVRTRFTAGGVDAVLSEQRQTHYRQALTGLQQAHLIAIACSPVPTGHDHWTLRMLGRTAVELGFVEKISPETIRALLKKTNSSPGDIGSGASPR
jgi:Winged helix-turn helix